MRYSQTLLFVGLTLAAGWAASRANGSGPNSDLMTPAELILNAEREDALRDLAACDGHWRDRHGQWPVATHNHLPCATAWAVPAQRRPPDRRRLRRQ